MQHMQRNARYTVQHTRAQHMGVSILNMYSAHTGMPNTIIWGVTAVFPQLGAKSYTPNCHFCLNCPQYRIQVFGSM